MYRIISTNALLSVRAGYKSFIAFALVGSFSIDAVTILAKVRISGAFVDVAAIVRHANLSVPFWADAHKGADEVLTGEFAVICRCSAFIHI